MKIQITTEFGQKGLMVLNNERQLTKDIKAGKITADDLIVGYDYNFCGAEDVEYYVICTKEDIKRYKEACKKDNVIATYDYNLRTVKEITILDETAETFNDADYELMESLR